MKILGTPVFEYLPAVGLALLTTTFLVSASGFPPDAKAFPQVVGWVVLALLALDVASRTQTEPGRALKKTLNPGSVDSKPEDAVNPDQAWHKQLSPILWLAALTAMLILVGVLYAVPLYLFVSLLIRAKKPLITALLISAVATGAIWVLFVPILRVELYRGVFFGG